MSVSNAYVKHSIVYHPVGVATAVVLGGLRRLTLNTGTEMYKDISDAELYADSIAVQAYKPTMDFTSVNVGRCLANLGGSAACISDDVTHPGIVAYMQKRGCSGPSSGSVHRSYTFQDGLVVPQSLTVSHRQPAEISYKFYGQGGTGPVRDEAAALPTHSGSSERFDMYSVTLLSAALGSKTGVDLSFAPSVFELGSDSELFDSFVALQSLMPVITIRAFAVSNLGTIDLDGFAVAHADSNIILRKRGVALGTAEHIKITFQGTARMETLEDASGLNPSEEVIVVDTGRDASNGPLVINAAFAIS